tara:strand:- start:114 stop:449 length:336 start_codon:yes stop_codon:yes gene_type:complete
MKEGTSWQSDDNNCHRIYLSLRLFFLNLTLSKRIFHIIHISIFFKNGSNHFQLFILKNNGSSNSKSKGDREPHTSDGKGEVERGDGSHRQEGVSHKFSFLLFFMLSFLLDI